MSLVQKQKTGKFHKSRCLLWKNIVEFRPFFSLDKVGEIPV